MADDHYFRLSLRGDDAFLSPEEARHALKSLRKRPGDVITGIDGQGSTFIGRLGRLLPDGSALVEIETIKTNVGEHDFVVRLILPLLSSRDRMEWMIEKSIELGASDIALCRFQRSEPVKVQSERLEKIMWATIKQCKRSRLPRLRIFESLLNGLEELEPAEMRLLATCHNVDGKQKTDAARLGEHRSVAWIIGPEGDLTPQEIQRGLEAGFLPIDLGFTRLRAETAAVHVMSISKMALGY